MTHNDTNTAGTDTKLTRRGFVGAAGGALAVGLAGCSGLTQQSFEATPVVLPEAAHGKLMLAETARDSETITREGPTGNVEVEITSQMSVYQRGPARGAPTMLEKFLSGVNQTPGSGSNINALASNLGIDAWPLPFIKGGVQVSGDEFSLIVAEGGRGNDKIDPGQTMALVPGAALDQQSTTYRPEEGTGSFLPAADFFPSDIPSRILSPDVFFPSEIYSPDTLDEFRVFIPEVDQFMERVGMDSLPEDAERVESGQTIETADTVFVFAGDVISAGGEGKDTFVPDRAFDRGEPLPPLPLGLGVLATPSASVAGQEANPLVGMETAELLQQDAARRVLAATGLTDGDTVEWVGGPQRIVPAEDAPSQTSLLGTETEIATFGGVVSGEDGPWAVVLTVARITDDDHVIAVAGTTRPVSTADRAMEVFSEAAAPGGVPLYAPGGVNFEMAGPLFAPGGVPLYAPGGVPLYVPDPAMGRLERVE